jgi:catalase
MANRKEAGTDRQSVEYGDQRVERGQGGETHQVASGDAPRLTTHASADQKMRPLVRLEESW